MSEPSSSSAVRFLASRNQPAIRGNNANDGDATILNDPTDHDDVSDDDVEIDTSSHRPPATHHDALALFVPRGADEESWAEFLRSTRSLSHYAPHVSSHTLPRSLSDADRSAFTGTQTRGSSGSFSGTQTRGSSASFSGTQTRDSSDSFSGTQTRRSNDSFLEAPNARHNGGLKRALSLQQQHQARAGSSPRPRNEAPVQQRQRSSTTMAVPRWQPDDDVSSCPGCDASFTWYTRKHHCRKCGRVVCASCSEHRITLPRQFIVQPPATTDDDESSSTDTHLGGGELVRVCDDCTATPPAEIAAGTVVEDCHVQDGAETARRHAFRMGPQPHGQLVGPRTASRPSRPAIRRRASAEFCPICNRLLEAFGVDWKDEEMRAQHVTSCIDSFSFSPPASTAPQADSPQLTKKRTNYILSYTATEGDIQKADDERECIICMDDFEVGQELGRLECLCRFHTTCIRGWWAAREKAGERAGDCPIHKVNRGV